MLSILRARVPTTCLTFKISHTRMISNGVPLRGSFGRSNGKHWATRISNGLSNSEREILMRELNKHKAGSTLGSATTESNEPTSELTFAHLRLAAGLGNLISDLCGIGTVGYVEKMATKMGIVTPPITTEQSDSRSFRWATLMGRASGITIGCLLGMLPLLLFPHSDKPTEPD